MSTLNARSYSSAKNLNLKGQGTSRGGILRFDGTNSTNPLSSTSNGLYVNASNQLIFSSQGTATTLGAAGGGSSAPSFDSLYNNDQTMAITGSTFTIDRSTGNGDVLTLTNTGAGSGDVLQITNVGSGNDIEGTSDTWHFTAAGDMTANMAVFAGDAGSASITLTAGDVLISDGSITLTDADNAASLTITNDTATTASVVVIAGSGAFTGSTTTSFMTITPSGLTTGTAVYLPVAALTTGKAVHVVANAVTSGIAVHIASSVASTTLTGAGRLFKVDHTGNATGTGILSEFNSAAADETVILKVTASAALALGVALQVSGSAITTGKAITAANLDSLTTGMGLHIASSATAITTTGRLLLIDHTGVSGTSATLNEIKTAAADETILLALTANDMATGNMLNFGTNIALTTGQLIKAAHTTSVIADGGSMLRLSSTGINTGGSTNGTMLDIQTTAQVAGTQVLFKAAAVTTGVVLSVISTTGLTSGSLIRATSSTAGAIATNGAISFSATGNFTSTSRIGFLNVAANSTTSGTIAHISGTAVTDGTVLSLEVVEATITTGLYFQCFDGTANDFSIAKYGATVIAGNAQGTAALTVTAGDLVLTAGNATVGGKFILSGTETIAAGGTSTALSLTKSVHYIDADAGGDTFTLADGVAGQIMTILLTSSTGVATITPTNLAGGTSVTLNADGDSVVLQFMDTEWFILGGNSYAVV